MTEFQVPRRQLSSIYVFSLATVLDHEKTKCESEFRRGTCTFRSKTTQELQNSRFQDANFPLNTFFRSQLCRITKN
jgi:hypothetical protein